MVAPVSSNTTLPTASPAQAAGAANPSDVGAFNSAMAASPADSSSTDGTPTMDDFQAALTKSIVIQTMNQCTDFVRQYKDIEGV